MLSVLAIWFLVASIGALSFGAFASGQKKLIRQVTRRHERS